MKSSIIIIILLLYFFILFPMKTYYIFRHGETVATKRNTGYGTQIFSARILESAKPIITRMALSLKDIRSDLHLTSPILRCRQTAQLITLETGKKFTVDWRLTEIMEPFPILKWRIKNFLNQAEKSGFQTILICTHGAVIAGLVAFLTKGDFIAGDLVNYPPPGTLIKVGNGKIEEFDFN